jgi:hypothetical protein
VLVQVQALVSAMALPMSLVALESPMVALSPGLSPALP